MTSDLRVPSNRCSQFLFTEDEPCKYSISHTNRFLEMKMDKKIILYSRHLELSQFVVYFSYLVHGGLSEWSSWSSCDVTCGGGFTRRTRACNNLVPQYDGNDCVGKLEDLLSCGVGNCPGEYQNGNYISK